MAKVTLEIELDEPDRSYAPREMIRGKVHAQVTKAVRCDALVVGFTLRILSDYVTTDIVGQRTIQLFTGDWKAGDFSYPFELPGPKWPPNYPGTLNRWQWMITATADIPLAIDAKTMEPIAVAVSPDDGLVVVHKNPGDPALVAGNRKAIRYGWAVAGIGVVIGGIADFCVNNDQLLALAISITVIAAVFALFRSMKLKDIGAPQLLVEHRANEHSNWLTAQLWVKRGARIKDVICSFLVYEHKRVREGGTDSGATTYEETVFEAPISMKRISDDGAYLGELSLPASGKLPYTIQERESGIGWSVKATLIHQNGIDYPLPDAVLWARPARGPAAD